MMIPRLIRPRLKALLAKYPAVTLLGPRQAGKTTLAKSLGGPYFDLEQESDRLKLDLQWRAFDGASKLVVLDEAQAWPDLFPRLRGTIDAARRKNGRFLLLGSVSPTLMKHVSESLAGRLGICELTPVLVPEMPKRALDDIWLRGGFPDGGILRPTAFPDWQHNYLRLLVERDLPNWGLPAAPHFTLRMLKMLAATHAGIWNASELSRSLGISYHTVNSYLDYLEGAFLVRRLQPFHASIRKRLVKSPKIYWRDSGLLHSLLGVTTSNDLLSQPWVGGSWEGFVIEQILGTLSMQSNRAQPYYFRTSDGHEIDLVLERDGKRWAIEIKLTSSPGTRDVDHLVTAAGMIGAQRCVLVSRATVTLASEKAVSTNLQGILKLLRAFSSN